MSWWACIAFHITLSVLVDRNSSLTLLRAEWSDDKEHEQEHFTAASDLNDDFFKLASLDVAFCSDAWHNQTPSPSVSPSPAPTDIASGACPEQELLWDDYALFFPSALITAENGRYTIKFDPTGGKASEWILAASTYAHVPSDAALASMAVVLIDAAHFVAIHFLDDLIGFYPECGGAVHDLGRQAQCVTHG